MNDELDMFDDLLEENQESVDTNEESEQESEQDTGWQSPLEFEEPSSTEDESNQELPDYSDNGLYAFLQSRGVSDPSKMVFQTDDGGTEELDFNSLDASEQQSILEELTRPNISEYEASVIQFLRNNQVTLDQLVDDVSNQKLQQYLANNPNMVPEKTYSVDEYSDEELYLADLKIKYPQFSDDELLSKLESAKDDETLFAKEVEALRTIYKEQEDQELMQAKQNELQQIEDLRENLRIAAVNFNEIALDYKDEQSDSLVIEDSDKQQMLSYLLDQDSEGKSQFVRDIENPDTLIELAWLRTQGAELLSGMTQYWKDLLSKERKENKRLQSQIDKLNKKSSMSVVMPKTNTNELKPTRSIWDNSGLI